MELHFTLIDVVIMLLVLYTITIIAGIFGFYFYQLSQQRNNPRVANHCRPAPARPNVEERAPARPNAIN